MPHVYNRDCCDCHAAAAMVDTATACSRLLLPLTAAATVTTAVTANGCDACRCDGGGGVRKHAPRGECGC